MALAGFCQPASLAGDSAKSAETCTWIDILAQVDNAGQKCRLDTRLKDCPSSQQHPCPMTAVVVSLDHTEVLGHVDDFLVLSATASKQPFAVHVQPGTRPSLPK